MTTASKKDSSLNLNRRRVAIATVIIGSLVSMYLSRSRLFWPRPKQVIDHNSVISDLGDFQIASSNAILRAERLPSGEVQLSIGCPTATALSFLGFEPEFTISRSLLVGSQSAWFASVDRNGGLWVCSESDLSDVRAVLVNGIRRSPSGRLIDCIESVSDTSRWNGAPPGFLKRLKSERPVTKHGERTDISF